MSILEDEKRGEREKGEKYRAKVEDGIRIDRIHCGEILCISKRFDWARINFPREGEREMIPPRIRLESFPFDILYLGVCTTRRRKKEWKEEKKEKSATVCTWIGVARFPRNDNNPSFFSRGRWTAAPPRSVYTRSAVQTTLSKWISAPK